MTKDIYTIEEKEALMKAIGALKGESISIAKLAKSVGLNPNRSRFVVDVLIETGKVKKIPVKSYNKHYTRFTYELVK